MQDHEFEKQVHQKMEEISILPSDAVWKEVEKRLHAGDKRRHWMIWLPFLLIALSICGYLIFTKSSLSPDNPVLSGPARQPSMPTTNNIIPNKEPGITTIEESRQSRENARPKTDTDDENTSISETVTGGSLKKDRPSEQIAPLVPRHVTGSVTALDAQADPATPNRKPVKNVEATSRQPSLTTTTFPPNQTQAVVDQQPAITSIDSLASRDLRPVRPSAIQKARVDSSINTAEVMDSRKLFASSLIKTINRKRSVQWGIAIEGNRTGISNGNLNGLFSNAVVADVNNNFSAVGSSGNPGPSMIYIPPSALKPGNGFSAGAYLKKQFTRRSSLSVGLQYSRATTSHKVGTRIDSTLVLRQSNSLEQKDIEEYFKTGNTSLYNNKYHFLMVPINLQTRLTRNRSIPVYWDLGVSVSRLIATNALHFDGNARVYYKDISLFNRTNINLMTGLPVGIVSRERFSVKAGPHMAYGITNLIKKERSTGKHFLFIGLKASIDLFNN